DRPVQADQGGAAHVADDAVVLDRLVAHRLRSSDESRAREGQLVLPGGLDRHHPSAAPTATPAESISTSRSEPSRPGTSVWSASVAAPWAPSPASSHHTPRLAAR